MKQLISKKITSFVFVLLYMMMTTVVIAQNTPPTAVNDYFFTPVNTPVTGNLLNNDSDPNWGDNLIANTIPTVAPINGTITITPNGAMTYVSNTGFIGIDSLTYQICDDGTPIYCDSATVYINVSNWTGAGNCNALPDTIFSPYNTYCHDNLGICLPIPVTNNPYSIYIDGQLYNSYISGCDGDTTAIYDMDSVSFAGAWDVTYTRYSHIFTMNGVASFSDLADSLNARFNTAIYGMPWVFDATENEITRNTRYLGHLQFTNSSLATASVTPHSYIASTAIGVKASDQLLTITDGTCIENVVLSFDCYPNIDSVSIVPVSSCVNTDGSITVHATGVKSKEYKLYDPIISAYTAWQTSPTFTNLQGNGNYRVRVRNAGETQNTYFESIYLDLRGADSPEIQGITHTGNTITVHATGSTLPLEYSYRHTYSAGYTTYQSSNQFSPYSFSNGYKGVKVRYNNGQCEEIRSLSINAASAAITANDDVINAPNFNTYTINVLANDSHTSGTALVVTPQNLSNSNGSVTLDAAGNLNVNTAYYGTGSFYLYYQVCEQGSSLVCTTGSVRINSNHPVTDTIYRTLLYGKTSNIYFYTNELDNTTQRTGEPLELQTNVADVVNSTLGPYNLIVSYAAHTMGTDTTPVVVRNNTATDTFILVLTVTPNNFISGDTMYYNTNTASTYNVLVDDSYDTSSVINVIPVTQPSNGTVVIDLQGNATYTPNTGFSGADMFEYEVCGSYGTVTICDTARVDVFNASLTALAITNVTTTQASCDTANGSITIMALGGLGAYQYSIDSGATWQASSTFINLSDGWYAVYVKDAANVPVAYSNNNVYVSAMNMPVYLGVTYYANILTINATGIASQTLEYSKDCGATWTSAANAFAVSPGTYCIGIRYANTTYCERFFTETVTNPTNLAIANVVVTPDLCNQNVGSITVTATGGAGNTQYKIAGQGLPFQSSNVFTNLTGGTYDVVATDGASYVSNTVVVAANYFPLSYLGYNLSNDTLSIHNSGSSFGAVEYSLNCGTTWQSDSTFHPVSQGSYCIGIRYANGACESYYTRYIGDSLSIDSIYTTPATCGGNDGTITVYASNGAGTYEYSIDSGLTWQTNNVFTNQAAGYYPVYVKDDSITVADFTYAVVANTGSPSYDSSTYNAGTITITASGTSALEYSLDCGATWQTSNVFTGMSSGNYCVGLRYINGSCPTYTNITTSTPPSSLSITGVVSTETACNQSTGTITINATGGTGNYQYQITGYPWQTGDTFPNLGTGTYSVLVTDGVTTVAHTSTIVIDTELPPVYSYYVYNNDSLYLYEYNPSGQPVEYSIDCGGTWQTSNVFYPVLPTNHCVAFRNPVTGCSNTAQIDLNNYAPQAENDTIDLNITNTIDLLYNDYDPNGDAIAIAPNLVTLPNHGTVIISANGSAMYTQVSTFLNGADTFAYRVCDTGSPSLCDTAMVFIINGTIATPLAITNVADTNATCGQNNGNITITATGGTGNYEYKITGYNWQNSNSFNNLAAGTYHVSVKDGVDSIGYTANPVIITDQAAPVISGTGYGFDTLIIYSTTGSMPMEYSIDCGTTWQSSSIFYPVSVTSGNLCIGVRFANGSCPVFSNITITNNPPIAVNDSTNLVKTGYQSLNIIYNDYDTENNALFTVPQTVYYGLDSMTLDNNGLMTIPTNALNLGSYMINYQLCEVYNPNNCSQGTVYFNIVPPTNTLYDTIAIGSYQVICIPDNLPGTPISLNTIATSGMTNAVIDSVVGTCLYVYADNYGNDSTVVVMCDNFGFCDTTLVYLNVQDGVWPGDTDDDTYANIFDLLNIGLGYGLSGTPRSTVSNTWTGFVTPTWNMATPISNIDYKHADCNGDGTINADDTLAILLNYNQSYQRNGGGSSTGVPLYVQPDTSNGPHFSLPIIFGEPNNQGVNVYGGAFSINYDTAYIKQNSVHITFDNSWVGVNNTDMISIHKNFGNQQQIDGGFTRIDATNVTGHGILGRLNFTIKDDILQRGSFNVDSVIIGINISNTKFISYNEMPIDIDERSSGQVVTSTKNQLPNLEQFVSIFPNPAQHYTNIESPKYAIEQVSIIDITGKILHQETIADKHSITLNVSPYPSGVYTVQLVTPQGIATKRLTIVK